MTQTALVALGGLLGSVARYWLVGLARRLHGAPFPLGTFAVNVVGSFVVGVVMGIALDRRDPKTSHAVVIVRKTKKEV